MRTDPGCSGSRPPTAAAASRHRPRRSASELFGDSRDGPLQTQGGPVVPPLSAAPMGTEGLLQASRPLLRIATPTSLSVHRSDASPDKIFSSSAYCPAASPAARSVRLPKDLQTMPRRCLRQPGDRPRVFSRQQGSGSARPADHSPAGARSVPGWRAGWRASRKIDHSGRSPRLARGPTSRVSRCSPAARPTARASSLLRVQPTVTFWSHESHASGRSRRGVRSRLFGHNRSPTVSLASLCLSCISGQESRSRVLPLVTATPSPGLLVAPRPRASTIFLRRSSE